ncbi:hypothetical protein HPB50_024325 [Hyalomma asiaticum]|uniref:Uncharacterized protein n=1 Tax=Hyalomma asiaticum TaxID=266040 RepID=A0ACB7TDU1_HYAAI|nr:hypothetical protein HPB50_024325 [Hyalomma asiaticum]
MNIFRLAGDLSHLLAIIILLLKIWRTRSCSGISGKSQILFSITYTARYLDLFTTFVSPYNSVMKVVFLATSSRPPTDRNHDTFRIEFLLVPVCLLALLVNHEFTPLETQPGGHERGFLEVVFSHATLLFRDPLEVLWTLSIYLEAVAILPQLFLVSKTGEAETITSHYLFCLGSYRALYLLNWVYRYYTENFYDLIAIVAGLVQTILYCDFFYLYVTRGGS